MKLSLNVEADAINVLALNMGRIAVDVDGIVRTERRGKPERLLTADRG